MRYKKAFKEIKESDVHQAFVQFASTQKWFDSLIHIANEMPLSWLNNKQSKGWAIGQKKIGMKKGVADLFLALPNRSKSGLWIEIKRPGQKLRDSQVKFLQRMRKNNYATLCSSDIHELINETLKYVSLI